MAKDAKNSAVWFGRLLDWQWDPQREMHAAWHDGRTHYITKLDRRSAEAHRSHPGWHLWDDNFDGDPDRWDGVGPGLGSRVGWAKRMAEAWIICPYMDMMGQPSLRAALTDTAGWDGRIIRLHEDQQRFTVEHRDGTPVALLVPVFLGAGGATSIRWRALTPAEDLIAGADTWAGLIGQLGSELTDPGAARSENDQRAEAGS